MLRLIYFHYCLQNYPKITFITQTTIFYGESIKHEKIVTFNNVNEISE